MIRTLAATLATSTCIASLATPAAAQTREYNIPPGSLKSALDTYVRQSGRQIVYRADQVRSARSPGTRGQQSAEAALAAILANSGFTTRVDGNLVAIVRTGNGAVADRSLQSSASEYVDDEGDTVVVTGTRIRGARPTGEVVTVKRGAIVEAGQVDIGETIRSLPQNFSGGQNPGVGSGAGLVNTNVNSASSANLRGLGPDATLTLLNGHRLPYNSAFQAVDISSIPLAAVDRVEVVPDGASALYGSDAVGGVVNVVLRRDFNGVTTSAQLGASTDGGFFRQQADVVAGTTWNGGGAMLAYDFANNSEIQARQRSYTRASYPENSLYPSIRRHAANLTAHQDVASGIKVGIDALYAKRNTDLTTGSNATVSLRDATVESYMIAPSLQIDVGSRWEAKILGVYGRDETRFGATFVPMSGATSRASGQYFNEVFSLEVGLEGPLFALPGGDARAAFGGGLRNNQLSAVRNEVSFRTGFDVDRKARYGYAELYLPFVSDRNAMQGLHRFSVSAAVRYEDYPGLAELATPRVGINYAPFDGLNFRGSWSRSFKAPTLYQQYIFSEAYLFPASFFGAGSGTDTVFYASGGNPNVGPERARSWTAGIELKPPSIPELTLSATWYDIRYTDRVVSPISGGLAAALRNPGYANQIEYRPTASRLAELIAASELGLQNFTSTPLNPSTVVVLIDNRNTNVATWAVEGLDARIAWNRDLGDKKSVSLDLSGSWLKSTQQVTPGLPTIQLSGQIFSPSRYRARGTARYQSGNFIANAAVNYIGALYDRRFAQERRLSPSATVDLGFHYTLIQGEKRDPGLEVSLTVQNLLNEKPESIGQTGPSDTPYDSTNYSAIGRFIAFGIRRHW